MQTEANVLRAALLWLRNHYDGGSNSDAEMKAAVVARVDAVLRGCEPSTQDMDAFRDAHPAVDFYRAS